MLKQIKECVPPGYDAVVQEDARPPAPLVPPLLAVDDVPEERRPGRQDGTVAPELVRTVADLAGLA